MIVDNVLLGIFAVVAIDPTTLETVALAVWLVETILLAIKLGLVIFCKVCLIVLEAWPGFGVIAVFFIILMILGLTAVTAFSSAILTEDLAACSGIKGNMAL